LPLIPKAKTAKIVCGIIDAVSRIPGTSDLQITLCKEMVEWTLSEKRAFLRQRVEARLASLLLESEEYIEALTLLSGLIKEVRRLDDKLLLVDIDLLGEQAPSLSEEPAKGQSFSAAKLQQMPFMFRQRSREPVICRAESFMLRRRITRLPTVTSLKHLNDSMHWRILRPTSS
jgi:hypothetical protein